MIVYRSTVKRILSFSILLMPQVDDGNSESETSRNATTDNGVKRLHVSNIPFRFREADLRGLLGVYTMHCHYAHLCCTLSHKVWRSEPLTAGINQHFFHKNLQFTQTDQRSFEWLDLGGMRVTELINNGNNAKAAYSNTAKPTDLIITWSYLRQADKTNRWQIAKI